MKSSSYVDLELNLTFDLQVVINSGASMVLITGTASLGTLMLEVAACCFSA